MKMTNHILKEIKKLDKLTPERRAQLEEKFKSMPDKKRKGNAENVSKSSQS